VRYQEGSIVRRSKIVVPIHFVWATYGRLPLISEDVERLLVRRMVDDAEKLHCELLAIGTMPDHVHVAVMFPATLTISAFAKQLKGASSRLMKDVTTHSEQPFSWQEGYGAYAFHARLIPRVVSYIENQKSHHADGPIWPTLEETDEASPIA
jgi:REP element-mobilizing transposase RayT